LFVAFTLYLIYRFRLHQVLKMERMRMRLATDLHDDIGSTLSSISMYSEAVKKQVRDKMPQLENVLDKMGENSRKMVSSMSDIVWAVNPANDQGIKLFERMEAYASDACAVTETRLHFDCEMEMHSLSFPPDYRKNIYLIFKEALNNALKYANAQDIRITIERKGPRLHLVIKDNGKGFDTGTEYDGNGLRNMKTRAKEIHGELILLSAVRSGTTIDLYCKMP
jgi:signal transduction histidine kinase